MQKAVQEHDGRGDNRDEDEGQPTNTQAGPSTAGVEHPTAVIGKVTSYESEYMDSSDPSSYVDTSEWSTADDARRHNNRKSYYNLDTP